VDKGGKKKKSTAEEQRAERVAEGSFHGGEPRGGSGKLK
jgi:hypothetical protein